nr:MAG TPA: hypothetical protein [Caudoviricetes sp.]
MHVDPSQCKRFILSEEIILSIIPMMDKFPGCIHWIDINCKL